MISEGHLAPSWPRTLFYLATMLLILGALAPQVRAQAGEDIEFIELDGVIDPSSSRYLLRHIERAIENRSRVIIVRLDTPGGLEISMREIVQRMLSSEIPIVVWVAPNGGRAASAGVFITYAAHVAVMAPGTSIGAAHPVNLGGRLSPEEEEKATNDAAATLRSIARQRGRNVEWADRAVRESASLDATAAVSGGVVDFMAGRLDTLLTELDGREVTVGDRRVRLSLKEATPRFHKMSFIERILHTALRPDIAYWLLLFGLFALIFELYNPGIGAAGVLGGIALILGFYALSILPVSWVAVALLVASVAFFLADLHTAGLGIFTVGALLSLIAGSLLLFADAGPFFRLPWWAIAGAVAASLLFFISVMTAAMRARGSQPISGAEGMIGSIGVARTDIAPDGQVSAKGTSWRARTLGAAIPRGAHVRIRSVSGLLLIVEAVPEHERRP
ncbi:MAG: NfeD family protein [Actinomycetota bacterium]